MPSDKSCAGCVVILYFYCNSPNLTRRCYSHTGEADPERGLWVCSIEKLRVSICVISKISTAPFALLRGSARSPRGHFSDLNHRPRGGAQATSTLSARGARARGCPQGPALGWGVLGVGQGARGTGTRGRRAQHLRE